VSDWNKALNWGRLLHLTQKQRQGLLSDQELTEMRKLRGQQRSVQSQMRGTVQPVLGDWTRL
jgi:hypothetical protein